MRPNFAYNADSPQQHYSPFRRLSVCPTHGHHFSVHFSRRGTLPADQYLYHVKAHRSNGNNKGSGFSRGQNFRRKWRLKVRASDISHKLSVHFFSKRNVNHLLSHLSGKIFTFFVILTVKWATF